MAGSAGTIGKQIGCGLTAAALVGSYAVAATSVAGFGAFGAVLCCAVCFWVSVGRKDRVFAPDAFMLIPVLYVLGNGTPAMVALSTLLGAALYLLVGRMLEGKNVADCVTAGAGLGLALVATILLTNTYFGIGASGSYALEMLKSYRSLGFHPNFRGLLFGTITLFLMITYPFKFRKLNRLLPAEFVTLALPLALNFLLDRDPALTPIDEATALGNTAVSLPIPGGFAGAPWLMVAKGAVIVSLTLYANRSGTIGADVRLVAANGATGLLSGLPVRPFPIRDWSPLAAAVATVVTGAVLWFGAPVLQRLPMHAVGAMLIVSAWQHVPYKKLVSSFRDKGALEIVVVLVLTAAFMLLDSSEAFGVCVICAMVVKEVRREKA